MQSPQKIQAPLGELGAAMERESGPWWQTQVGVVAGGGRFVGLLGCKGSGPVDGWLVATGPRLLARLPRAVVGAYLQLLAWPHLHSCLLPFPAHPLPTEGHPPACLPAWRHLLCLADRQSRDLGGRLEVIVKVEKEVSKASDLMQGVEAEIGKKRAVSRKVGGGGCGGVRGGCCQRGAEVLIGGNWKEACRATWAELVQSVGGGCG